MNSRLYSKLAWDNIKKNSKTYVPYILTCIGSIAMYFILYSLYANPDIGETYKGAYLREFLRMGTHIVSIFMAVFLFYTNGFLVKRRKNEFGLLNVLGMEKRHISKMILFETLYTAGISFVCGIFSGALLFKAVQLLLFKITSYEIPMGFTFSKEALIYSVITFGVVFILIFLNTLRQIHLSNPSELLRGGSVGEREPKSKWFLTLLGIFALGGGYTIAITPMSPQTVIVMFFVAVILVIVGTYCLFLSGSISLLKLMRKNKGFYYQTKHFTSISGMIYRMKQNATGLANICITTTMVLVMLSTTVSLYMGMDELVNESSPRDMGIDAHNVSREQGESLKARIYSEVEKMNKTTENDIAYSYSMVYVANIGGRYFGVHDTDNKGEGMMKYRCIVLLTAEDYRDLGGRCSVIADDEALIASIGDESFSDDTITLKDISLKLKAVEADMSKVKEFHAQAGPDSLYLVVSDDAKRNAIQQELCEEDTLSYYIGFDSDLSTAQEEILTSLVPEYIENDDEWSMNIKFRSAQRDELNGIYGSMLFLGIFLSVMFLMQTVLIIYYKQVSEGYEDKVRFEIMQKVGMSKREVKKTIRSQVLTMFYLPIFAAAMHVLFAFSIIAKMLSILNMTNITLFAGCCIVTFIVFTILYTIVYSLTARTYYKIVS